MKLFRSSNIFESFKFPIILNKISGQLFFTVKTGSSEDFSSRTTFLDFFIFAASLTFTIRFCINSFEIPLRLSQPPTVVEIVEFLFRKSVTLGPVTTILINLHCRHEWFQIFNTFHRIDKKVKFSVNNYLSRLIN